jgi:hypothetical protein
MTKSRAVEPEPDPVEWPKMVYADHSHGVVHRVVNSQEELADFLAQGWREDLGA